MSNKYVTITFTPKWFDFNFISYFSLIRTLDFHLFIHEIKYFNFVILYLLKYWKQIMYTIDFKCLVHNVRITYLFPWMRKIHNDTLNKIKTILNTTYVTLCLMKVHIVVNIWIFSTWNAHSCNINCTFFFKCGLKTNLLHKLRHVCYLVCCYHFVLHFLLHFLIFVIWLISVFLIVGLSFFVYVNVLLILLLRFCVTSYVLYYFRFDIFFSEWGAGKPPPPFIINYQQVHDYI